MNRDDIVRMAQQTGWDFGWEMTVEQVCEFAALVAAAEREACAKLLDEMAAADKLSNYYQVAALRIRERGAP